MGHSLESSRPIMAPSVRAAFWLSLSSSNVFERQLHHVVAQRTPHTFQTKLIDERYQVNSKRTSKRYSTYSAQPSFAASENTVNTHTSSTTNGDPRLQEIKEWTQGFDRLESKRLQQQRYQPTPEKSENLSKLALGAKVERALDRRMTDQDAAMKPKILSEKPGIGRAITTTS